MYMVTLLFACYKNPSTVIELERGSLSCQYGLLLLEAFMTTQKWLPIEQNITIHHGECMYVGY